MRQEIFPATGARRLAVLAAAFPASPARRTSGQESRGLASPLTYCWPRAATANRSRSARRVATSPKLRLHSAAEAGSAADLEKTDKNWNRGGFVFDNTSGGVGMEACWLAAYSCSSEVTLPRLPTSKRPDRIVAAIDAAPHLREKDYNSGYRDAVLPSKLAGCVGGAATRRSPRRSLIWVRSASSKA
jgi:hypothetical protein